MNSIYQYLETFMSDNFFVPNTVKSYRVPKMTKNYILIYFRNFHRVKYNCLNSYFSNIDWLNALSACDLSDAYNALKKVIDSSIRKYVPLEKQCNNYKVPWCTVELKRLKNAKNKAYKIFKNSNSDTNRTNFYRIRKEYEFLNKYLYNNYINQAEQNIKCDSKSFWKFINSKRGNSGIPNNLTFNGQSYSDLQSICDGFARFFSSIYDEPDPDRADLNININASSDLHLNKIVEMRPERLSGNQTSFFDILHITPLDVEQALDGADINSQAGPDCIPNIFLKHCKQSLSVALALIFNRSLDQGVFLPEWRESFLTPIHKKGPKHQIENYRGIAKLSAIPKIFEKIVKDKIYVLISQRISTHQHGFLAGKSTITNLVSFTKYVLDSIEAGYQVDVIYTDFSKAFDKVDHNILIGKLSNLGIPSNFLNWVTTYL